MTSTAEESSRLVETTVLGAMRRHWLLVGLIVGACVALALAYGALEEDEYRATATVSAPRPAGSALQSDAQYLDSQVLLMNSRSVGDRAFDIARSTPAGASIDREELAPTIGEVEIIPPPSGSSGSYGTTIVAIQFTAPSADAAQAGVNALATAYDEVRSQEIADAAVARIAAIETAISVAASPIDVAALGKERVRALINQDRDLAQTASVSAAERPQAPAGSGLLTLLGVGLCLGLVAGGAAAFTRASRLQHVGEAHVAERVYGAPLLLELSSGRAARDQAVRTQANKLLGRAVAHRLKSLELAPRPRVPRRLRQMSVLAVVAAPGNRGRSHAAANLALALTDTMAPVLAVDAADGTMAATLRPGTVLTRPGADAGRSPARSSLRAGLSVLDVSDGGPDDWGATLLGATDRTVVVDCPPVASSAWAVDLLARCDSAVVLVRADEPVRQHVDVARWLELTDTTVLGCVFIPYGRRRLRGWRPRRRGVAPAARAEAALGRQAQQSTTSSRVPDGTRHPLTTSRAGQFPTRLSE